MSDAILDPTTADATAPTAEPGPVLTPIQEAAARLKELYPDVVSDDTREGYEGLVVYADSLPEVAKSLRDELGFNYLSSLTGVDYLEEGKLEAVYHLYCIARVGGAWATPVPIQRSGSITP